MLYSAFIVGFMGSAHCAGMCGALAAALPLGNGRSSQLLGVLLYHLGRVTTYSLLGLISGLIGTTIMWAGGQKVLSITLGVGLVIIAVFSINLDNKIFKSPTMQRFIQPLQLRMGKLLQQHRLGGLYSLGLLNGLLPCGMVYIAVFGALAAGDIWSGGLYMLFFGLGTLPLMLTISLVGQRLGSSLRRYIFKLFPVAVAGVGILLIMRGFSVEFPEHWDILNPMLICKPQ
ncbi:MAG: sulfite exporter TauE/SafE family protein [Saprospiraceae bacterium]